MKSIRNLHRPLRVIFLVAGLLLAGGIASLIWFHRDAVTPQTPQQQAAQPSHSSPTTFRLPNSSVDLPKIINASLFTSPDGLMVLVNKQSPIPIDYAPANLILPEVAYRTDKSKDEVMVRQELAAPLKDMFAAAKSNGIELMIGSAYRSATLQETYFNSYVASDGLAAAEKYSAHPGTSEHQTGLAADFTTTDRHCYLVECFADTMAGKWLAEHAHEYGFILRYMKGKEEITGYQYEPWHFRYIGNPYATAVYQSGLTYEEAYPLIKAHAK